MQTQTAISNFARAGGSGTPAGRLGSRPLRKVEQRERETCTGAAGGRIIGLTSTALVAIIPIGLVGYDQRFHRVGEER